MYFYNIFIERMFEGEMVREYLEKTKLQFEKEKESIIDQIHSCENKQKENIKFIQMLEETNDSSYEAFSPRETNVFNHKKFAELHEEQKQTEEQIIDLQNQLGELDFKIAEITSVIKVVEKDEDDISSDEVDADTRLALLNSVETERQRIARDLHDSTTQNLTSLVHKTELCTKLIDKDPVRCKLELFSVNKCLRKIIEDMRGLIYDLRPMSFDDIGFDVTVERALDKFKRFNSINCTYKVEGEPYPIDNVVQITLLRVIQEACNNAIKHASASNLTVSMKYTDSQLKLMIQDDGKGFDVTSMQSVSRDDNTGFGLSMMKERVYLLSGKLDIQSSLGNGCSICVTIPILKEGK